MKANIKYTFGEKLRTVRNRRGLTLRDVAKRANVSESLVSQVERNKVSPSIDTLLRIADVLNLDYEYLFSNYRQKRKIAIVKANERESIHRNNITIHQLSIVGEITKDPAIEAFLLEIEPTGEKGDREYGHSGWEFGIILEGQAELMYDYEIYRLDEGDSISFPSDMPHLLKNIGYSVLKAIWVVSPPRKIFRS